MGLMLYCIGIICSCVYKNSDNRCCCDCCYIVTIVLIMLSNKVHTQHISMENLSTPLTGIEDLCAKRDELHRQTLAEEEEKNRIQNDIRTLTERLAKVNESLAKKMAQRNEFDKTIAETEAAYMKVCIPSSLPAFLFLLIIAFLLHCSFPCLKL